MTDTATAPPAVHAPSMPGTAGPVELPGRGTTWVRDIAGPPGAPTLVLLHGWTATADINWFTTYPALARHFRVLAIDHRGHGRGIRSKRRFRLADCADDVAAVADVLGIDRFVPVGYSMGGPVAQLTWHRHPHRVQGLVLCATSRNFGGRPAERMMFAGLAGMVPAGRLTPRSWKQRVAERLLETRVEASDLEAWIRSEFSRGDTQKVVEAGAALGQFSSHRWIGGVDVPTAVVVTEADNMVPAHRQHKLADAIPGATVIPVAGDHAACVAGWQEFVPALVRACRTVTRV